jgi:hypothetical protein
MPEKTTDDPGVIPTPSDSPLQAEKIAPPLTASVEEICQLSRFYIISLGEIAGNPDL